MLVTKTFTVMCPEYEEEATVIVKYIKTQTIGNSTTTYMYSGHKCSIGSFRGCPREICPVIE